jgi:hypothetical protein
MIFQLTVASFALVHEALRKTHSGGRGRKVPELFGLLAEVRNEVGLGNYG